MCDMRRDLRSIVSEVGIRFGVVQSILSAFLGMSKVSARWVHDQKRTRLNISRSLLSRYEDDLGDFIERVVAQVEIWVHHFDTESKLQSKPCKHPCSPLLRNLREFIQQRI